MRLEPADAVAARRAAHVPDELWARLRPYQQAAVEFVLQRGGRALIADEPGLGKTIEVRRDRGANRGGALAAAAVLLPCLPIRTRLPTRA